MSRIGKRPVPVPSGVTATVERPDREGERPEGRALLHRGRRDCACAREQRRRRQAAQRQQAARSKWGMSRTMVANLVEGVTKGYTRELEIQGVGYRAAVQGKNLQLQLGFSHEILHPIPAGIEVKTPKPDRDRDQWYR